MFNFWFIFFPILLRFHREIKEFTKSFKKNTEQKVRVYFTLHVIRQLLDHGIIFLCADSLVLVVGPSVVKELFNHIFIFDRNGFTIVKTFDETQPFG